MRIAINCRSFLLKNYTGIGRYAFNLVKSLSEIDKEDEFWLYVQKKYFDFKRSIPRVPADNFTVKVDWFGQGLNKTLSPVDIYHTPTIETLSVEKTKIIVTVHDLVYKTYPQGHTQQSRDTAEKQLTETVKKADRIICCSQSTINDLRRNFSVREDQISLVYQGVDKNIFYPLNDSARERAAAYLRKKGIDQPFLLFVGTIEPRKNLQNLLLALSILKKKKLFKGKLVVSGMKGWMVEGLEEVIKKFDLTNDVIFPGYVADEDLRALYNLCEVFIFPSFYEGFGFPIVEAFSCGAAVITSNVSACPEISADAAIMIDPYNPDQIADAVIRMIDDKTLKNNLRVKALRRANHFSFQKTAQETLAVYKDVYVNTK
ncbi:MAG: glycosyltransferase family 4 protein [Candidatus Omnitrophica bacterium]|nr:glycosyltransferase family 4 protein [Candidatus Omnitrophota bacterium]